MAFRKWPLVVIRKTVAQLAQSTLQAAIGYTGLSTDAIINTVRYGGLLGMLCHVRFSCQLHGS